METSAEQMLQNGRILLDFVDQRGFLNTNGCVLDVGCGYGRIAYSLVERGFTGTYLGLDILGKQITWLQENLHGRGPARLEFRHLDVRNAHYNPGGALEATQVSLPAPDTPPDLVLAFSLFTHMRGPEVVHYIHEIAGLMDARSTLCATFFLMNESWAECEAAGKSRYPLRHRIDEDCRCYDEADPLHVIAYREEWVLRTIDRSGLELADEVHPGSWCGRGRRDCYQDTLFLRLKR